MYLYAWLCTRLSSTLLAALYVHIIEIPYRAFPERVGPRILSLESVDYHGTNVFMLGALGIMRANGGYVMRTAFRRVHHAYCWVVFK